MGGSHNCCSRGGLNHNADCLEVITASTVGIWNISISSVAEPLLIVARSRIQNKSPKPFSESFLISSIIP